MALDLAAAAAHALLVAQACSCGCSPPAEGYLGPGGQCVCPCTPQAPAMTVETLAGPPKPPKAGGGSDSVNWTVEPAFDDGFDGGFGWPWWGYW